MADTEDEVATTSFEIEKPTKRLQRSSFRNLVCNKCCFCVPLRTGSLILAYLYLVGLIASGMFSIFALANLTIAMSRFPEISHDTVIITFLVINSVDLGQALFAIAFNVLLLIGLHKVRKKKLCETLREISIGVHNIVCTSVYRCNSNADRVYRKHCHRRDQSCVEYLLLSCDEEPVFEDGSNSQQGPCWALQGWECSYHTMSA